MTKISKGTKGPECELKTENVVPLCSRKMTELLATWSRWECYKSLSIVTISLFPDWGTEKPMEQVQIPALVGLDHHGMALRRNSHGSILTFILQDDSKQNLTWWVAKVWDSHEIRGTSSLSGHIWSRALEYLTLTELLRDGDLWTSLVTSVDVLIASG